MRVGTCRGSLPTFAANEFETVPLEFCPLIRVATNLDLDIWSAPLPDLVDEFFQFLLGYCRGLRSYRFRVSPVSVSLHAVEDPTIAVAVGV